MTISTLDWNQTPPAAFQGGAVTIGNFDGVHLGHAALLTEARQQVRTRGGPVVAVTFDPHPLQILRPAQFQPVLTTVHDRAELLLDSGADHVVLLRTTPALLQLTAEEFFQQVIVDRLAARALVEGPNFGFGRNRQGNIETLAMLCGRAGVNLVVVPPVQFEGKPVSSSRVRNALLRGAVRETAALLRRPYRLRGTVATGRQRGRAIGFPTANLEHIQTLVPGDGVYAVRVYLPTPIAAGGRGVWPGAANIGPNPTFGEHARKVEVHVIGFEGDLLGQALAVDFLERLRDTRPFGGVNELVEQLRRDVEQARQIADSIS
jgi:riboflavin kinase/FMN adenylyltransferase